MSVIDTVRNVVMGKKTFAALSTNASTPTDKTNATKELTSDLIGYILGLTAFNDMGEEEIYEQLYIWESEIGGSIDRMSTMVGDSFQYCFVKDDETGSASSAIAKKMLKDANKIAEEIDVRNHAEMFADIINLHGNLFLEDKGISVDILPNKYVTLIDTLDRLKGTVGKDLPTSIIMRANYLVLYESDPGQKILPKDKFIHIKYKSTPLFISDNSGRSTYSIYSPSPLHRVVLPVWWKRQTMVIDILWRMMNVPREHHAINAEMFSLDKYGGTMPQRRLAAQTDAQTFTDAYALSIKNKMPDQAYVSLDTVDIKRLETGSSGYMQTNELIDQINQQIWTALNMPKSMITGESTSSYASELVIANYTTQKVQQIAFKIKPVILGILRKRLSMINPAYPVDLLDYQIDLDLGISELEMFRQMAIMAELGTFTDDEIREVAKYKPLTEEQRKHIIKQNKIKQDMMSPPVNKIPSPETAQSSVQHSTKGESAYRNKERQD